MIQSFVFLESPMHLFSFISVNGIMNDEDLAPTRDNMYKILCDIIVEQLEIDYDEISEDSKFIDDLNADSLDIVEMVMKVEELYDIEVDDDIASSIVTVQDVLDYLNSQLDNKS